MDGLRLLSGGTDKLAVNAIGIEDGVTKVLQEVCPLNNAPAVSLSAPYKEFTDPNYFDLYRYALKNFPALESSSPKLIDTKGKATVCAMVMYPSSYVLEQLNEGANIYALGIVGYALNETSGKYEPDAFYIAAWDEGIMCDTVALSPGATMANTVYGGASYIPTQPLYLNTCGYTKVEVVLISSRILNSSLEETYTGKILLFAVPY